MEHLGITLVAVFVLFYATVSKRLESSPFTPPMAFAGLGLLLGPLGFRLLEIDAESEALYTLAEITLLLVLFADASTIDLRILKRNYSLPLRLLAVGLPLTIASGAAAAMWVFPGWSLWQAALIGAILAPTDAALGQAVVTNSSVPARIRQGLNVESGLNDGICLPIVMMFLALAAGQPQQSTGYWAEYALGQLALGPVAGVAGGYFGGRAVQAAAAHGWMNHAFHQISSLMLALLAYCLAELIGGNGFIAAFVAGMTFGNTANKRVCETALEFAETEGVLLGLSAFFVFGAVGLAPALRDIGAAGIGYALLSLTILRMAPVALSLVGSRFDLRSILFIGWFGPRGLASILYVLIAVEDAALPGRDQLYGVAMGTVLLSVVAHGLTAAPWARAYAGHAEAKTAARPDWAVAAAVEEMPVRTPFRLHRSGARSGGRTDAAG